jgi:hypothetical protein
VVADEDPLNKSQKFILEMMKENDTLTVKRGMSPVYYLNILAIHREKNGGKSFRLEALATAIPTLVKVCEMLEICDVARKTKVKATTRRMTEGNPGTVIGR